MGRGDLSKLLEPVDDENRRQGAKVTGVGEREVDMSQQSPANGQERVPLQAPEQIPLPGQEGTWKALSAGCRTVLIWNCSTDLRPISIW